MSEKLIGNCALHGPFHDDGTHDCPQCLRPPPRKPVDTSTFTAGYVDGYNPERLFRFFDDEAHADALCTGEVYITTLEKCRQHEAVRCDREEATQFYEARSISGDWPDLNLKEVSARLGIDIDPRLRITNLSFENCSRADSLPDAFVLCLTEHPELGKFGRYGVQIRDPRAAFMALTSRVRYEARLYGAAMGCITYRKRAYSGLEERPGLIGFVKPESFSEELEARMLWVPHDGQGPFSPRVINCPEVGKLCSRL